MSIWLVALFFFLFETFLVEEKGRLKMEVLFPLCGETQSFRRIRHPGFFWRSVSNLRQGHYHAFRKSPDRILTFLWRFELSRGSGLYGSCDIEII